MNIFVLKKMLIEKLAKDLSYISLMPIKLNIKVYFLINIIDIIINFTIFKAKLSSK